MARVGHGADLVEAILFGSLASRQTRQALAPVRRRLNLGCSKPLRPTLIRGPRRKLSRSMGGLPLVQPSGHVADAPPPGPDAAGVGTVGPDGQARRENDP